MNEGYEKKYADLGTTMEYSHAKRTVVAICDNCGHSILAGRDGRWFHVIHGYTFCNDNPHGYLRGSQAVPK